MFLNCGWNLQRSENQEEYLSIIITEIIASERDVYLSVQKVLLQDTIRNQRVNGSEALPKLAPHHYFSIFPGIRDKLSWKKSALVISETFRLFVNMLTPDEKYSRRNMLIFWQQLHTSLSQKGKTFCRFLIVFLKCAWNLQRSEKQEAYPSSIIADIIASERDV